MQSRCSGDVMWPAYKHSDVAALSGRLKYIIHTESAVAGCQPGHAKIYYMLSGISVSLLVAYLKLLG
jgi:hypothetical protein